MKRPVGPREAERAERARRAVASMWERSRADVLAELEVIERATSALVAGELSDELRRAAQGSAHKVAGSAGTFGFARGSRWARELEHAYADPGALDPAHGPRLSELVASIRREIDAPAPPGDAPPP